MKDEQFEKERRKGFEKAREEFNMAMLHNLPTREPDDGYSDTFVKWHMAEMIRWLCYRLSRAHQRIDELEEEHGYD